MRIPLQKRYFLACPSKSRLSECCAAAGVDNRFWTYNSARSMIANRTSFSIGAYIQIAGLLAVMSHVFYWKIGKRYPSYNWSVPREHCWLKSYRHSYWSPFFAGLHSDCSGRSILGRDLSCLRAACCGMLYLAYLAVFCFLSRRMRLLFYVRHITFKPSSRRVKSFKYLIE